MWGKDAKEASSDIPAETDFDDTIYVDSFHKKLYGASYPANNENDNTEELVLLKKIFAEFLRKFIYMSARKIIGYDEEPQAGAPEIQSNDMLANLHYTFIMPTHWDVKCKYILREIFVGAELIQGQEMERLQFCTELESTIHYMQQPKFPFSQKLQKDLTKNRPYLLIDLLSSLCSFTIFEVKNPLPTVNTEVTPTKVIHVEPFVKIVSIKAVKSNLENLLKEKVMEGADLDDKALGRILDYYVEKTKVISLINYM